MDGRDGLADTGVLEKFRNVNQVSSPEGRGEPGESDVGEYP